MANKIIEKISHGLQGELIIPGDKSVTHRSVMFAALRENPEQNTNYHPSAP